MDEAIRKLDEFIGKSVSPFHTVMAFAEQFEKNGFRELKMNKVWQLEENEKYYVKIYDSSIMAFTIGNMENVKDALRIVSAHTDFPCFKIKPQPDIYDNKYHKINTEVYGGAILNTWLDRPLSVAGKVTYRGDDAFSPRTEYVNIDEPILTIPNVAIHMNRDVNKGIELNKQKDMLPVCGLISDEINKSDFMTSLLAKCGSEKDVLGYELYIYQWENGDIIGLDGSMFSSPRLDNITSVKAATEALCRAGIRDGINMVVCFDNEEIGSRTKQGAASNVLSMMIEKIFISLGYGREEFIDYILNGFMISADVAHGIHPCSPEKNDITNKPYLNGGTVIKMAASQSYANDAQAVAVIKELAKQSQSDVQIFVNRSDMPGGSTLGSITSSVLPMRTIDIGVPILAMHSARELMGVKDQENIEKLLTCFFT